MHLKFNKEERLSDFQSVKRRGEFVSSSYILRDKVRQNYKIDDDLR